MPDVFVVVGSHVRLDRDGLSAPAPGTVENLLRLCSKWADEVGWRLGTDLRAADGIVVGPGLRPPPAPVPVATVLPGQGVDGFRWGIRHVAFTASSPPETLRYGRDRDHVLDLRAPDGTAIGDAVLLHGGFWMDAWRRDLMDGVAVDLTGRGWRTWNVEYRRVGSGGGWPATGRDVLTAIDAVLGRPDALPTVLVGHSAGAQLALWAARERQADLRQVVSLAGLTDLDAADRHRLGGGAVARLLEGEPATDASPIERLPLGVPLVVAHAVGDAVVPVDQSRRFVAAARAAGDDVRVVEVDGADHMGLIEPERGWAQVAGAVQPAPAAGS